MDAISSQLTVHHPGRLAYGALAAASLAGGGPLALAAVALAAGLPLGSVAAALAWAGHVAFDRAIGLRLRSPDGFQRGENA